MLSAARRPLGLYGHIAASVPAHRHTVCLFIFWASPKKHWAPMIRNKCHNRTLRDTKWKLMRWEKKGAPMWRGGEEVGTARGAEMKRWWAFENIIKKPNDPYGGACDGKQEKKMASRTKTEQNVTRKNHLHLYETNLNKTYHLVKNMMCVTVLFYFPWVTDKFGDLAWRYRILHFSLSFFWNTNAFIKWVNAITPVSNGHQVRKIK